jgi:hypothetical protein
VAWQAGVCDESLITSAPQGAVSRGLIRTESHERLDRSGQSTNTVASAPE